MKKQILIVGLLSLTSIGFAQIFTPSGVIQGISGAPGPLTNVGIGTQNPNYLLDVRGWSTFGAGLTAPSFAWTPNPNEKGIIITGSSTGSNAFGDLMLGTNSSPASGQVLGLFLFGQKFTGASNQGVKSGIVGYSRGTGASSVGYGGEMSFVTTDDISQLVTVERMKIDNIGRVGVGNYISNPLFPFPTISRRFEVLSDKTTVSGNGNPHVRLTHTQQDPSNLATTGKFSEFHTTNNGDLGILSFNNTLANTGNQFFKERFIGINTINPGNSLEINSQFALSSSPNGQPPANSGAPTGWSGLRFTDLRSTSIPQANPAPRALSVNANGDVILIESPTIGNYCTSAANPLLGNYQIPLASNKFYFTGQSPIGGGVSQDAVGVGYNCGFILPGRFSVLENQTGGPVSTETYAGHFKNANQQLSTTFRISGGVYGESKGAQLSLTGTPPINVGGVFEGYGTQASIGVVGRISKSSFPGLFATYPGARYAIGGAFMSDTAVSNPINNNLPNVGVYGRATNSPFGNWGVFGEAPLGANNFAGYFNGDVNIFGAGWISGIWTSSDQRFKQDVKKIENVTEKLKKLNGYTYNLKTEEFKERNFDKNKQIGVLAQELKDVFPELVKEDNKGYLAVNYQGLIPVLIEAIKEQQIQIESQNEINKSQQQQIDELRTIVKSIANNTSLSSDDKSGNNLSVALSDKNSIVLNQNVPNPFAESTVITYNVPSDFLKAQIIFTTNEGKVIKSVDIITKGEGRINVFANDLSAGLYNYSLIIDGKTIETKKMIKN